MPIRLTRALLAKRYNNSPPSRAEGYKAAFSNTFSVGPSKAYPTKEGEASLNSFHKCDILLGSSGLNEEHLTLFMY